LYYGAALHRTENTLYERMMAKFAELQAQMMAKRGSRGAGFEVKGGLHGQER
jgi:hypothetical protein